MSKYGEAILMMFFELDVEINRRHSPLFRGEMTDNHYMRLGP